MLYEVQAKCGHVGKNMYTLKTFAISASSRAEAAALVCNLPRVKHHHRDAILRVVEIDWDRYHEIQQFNRQDPYFQCHSIQEQRHLCPNLTVYEEEKKEDYRAKITSPQEKPVFDGKQKIRNIKKYMRHNQYFEENDIA